MRLTPAWIFLRPAETIVRAWRYHAVETGATPRRRQGAHQTHRRRAEPGRGRGQACSEEDAKQEAATGARRHARCGQVELLDRRLARGELRAATTRWRNLLLAGSAAADHTGQGRAAVDCIPTPLEPCPAADLVRHGEALSLSQHSPLTLERGPARKESSYSDTEAKVLRSGESGVATFGSTS